MKQRRSYEKPSERKIRAAKKDAEHESEQSQSRRPAGPGSRQEARSADPKSLWVDRSQIATNNSAVSYGQMGPRELGLVFWTQMRSPTARPCQMAIEEPSGRRVARQRKRALHLAGAAIDDRADSSANADDRAKRKRRLLEGPAEFRAVRVDRSTKKT
jgi:hypothetical protein